MLTAISTKDAGQDDYLDLVNLHFHKFVTVILLFIDHNNVIHVHV